MTITVGGIEFDHVAYDRDGDVLYLHAGDPGRATEFDASPEGHALRFGPDDELVGITVLNARWLLDHEGGIVVTLPERKIELRNLGDVLAPAQGSFRVAARADANACTKNGEGRRASRPPARPFRCSSRRRRPLGRVSGWRARRARANGIRLEPGRHA